MCTFNHLLFIILTLIQLNANAQTVQCNSLAGGCDSGTAHNAGLQNAIAKFQHEVLYGGGDEPVVFASALDVDGTSLAQISYSCINGAVPPILTGDSIASSLESIVSCPNQCGSVAVTSNCGLGVLIAESAANTSCFTEVINVNPNGQLPSEVPFVGTFDLVGCYTDSTGSRALTGGSSSNANMTVENCVALAKGFQYAGVEYASQCFWGNSIASASTLASGQCHMPCGGAPLEVCGDGNHIDIYQDLSYGLPPTPTSTSTSTPLPTVVPAVGNFEYVGCFFDTTTTRVLVGNSISDQDSPGMTVEECIAYAQQGSWQYAGLEFAYQCFVGNTLHDAEASNPGDCSMLCQGSSTEYCGDGNRIQVYQDSTWINPTAADLAAVLSLYNEALSQALSAVTTYQDDISACQAATGHSGSKIKKRTPTEYCELVEITQDSQQLQVVQDLLDQAATQGNRLFVIAANDDIDRTTAALVSAENLGDLGSATTTAGESFSDVVSAAANDAATIASSPGSATPLLDFSSDLAASESAVEAIGLPAVAGAGGVAATGIFLVIASLYSLFDYSSSGGSGPQTTTAPTQTSTVTSSTSTSSASVCSLCSCILGTPIPMPDLPPDDTLTQIDPDWPLIETTITILPLPSEPDDIPDVANDLLSSRSKIFQAEDRDYEILEFNNASTEHALNKRYDVCNGALIYDNNNYPSTALFINSNPPPANSADLVPAIRKWIDFQENPPVNGVCTWQLVSFLNRNGNQEYATEHVYEKHFIGTFLKWLLFDVGYGPVSTCAVIVPLFGQTSTTPNSQFAALSPLQQLSNALSDNTRVDEFFILNANINNMKTTVLSYTQDTLTIPLLNVPWWEIWQRIQTAQLVFTYMRRLSVYFVFDDTNERIRAIIQAMDVDPFYAQFGAPLPQQEVGGVNTYANWLAAYDAWMAGFLRLKQEKMQQWVFNAVATLRVQINAEPNLTAAEKQDLINFINQQSQGTGLMAVDSFQFGPRYAALMQL